MAADPAKLRAARESLAVGPVESPAVLRATGKDAKDYLHRVTTQDVRSLAPGAHAYAALLEPKGRLVADLQVLVEPDGVLLVMDARAASGALPHLRKYVVGSKVAFEDLSPTLGLLPVLGPEAASRVGRLAGARLIADGRRGAPATDVVLPVAEAEVLRSALVAEGAAALDGEEMEALRVLGGFARFGADMGPERLPMEAGLTRDAISFTKGCYTGQEVVLRATARGHLQRGLVLLALPPGSGPGTVLTVNGQQVGQVTSVADGPDGRVGLGYVRRAHWKEGETLRAGERDAVVRRVIVEDGVPPGRH